MSIYSLFETDKNLETDGIWLDYGEFKIKVGRAGGANQSFINSLQKRQRAYKQQIERDTLPNEVGKRLLIEAIAESLVLDWEGVTDREGNLIPYSKDAVLTVLTDLPDLANDIYESAGKIAHFVREERDEDAKN